MAMNHSLWFKSKPPITDIPYMTTIWTIGHSNHPVEKFISLLATHNISAIADVRSFPSSRYNPQFNREALKHSLTEAGISYVFLGKELGARAEDESVYVDGQVQYHLLAKTELFRSGITRLLNGANRQSIAIMCAEKEPLDCHRTILVANELHKRDIEIKHILATNEIEDWSDSMFRLREQFKLDQPDLFRSEEQLVEEALSLQASKIAYKEPLT